MPAARTKTTKTTSATATAKTGPAARPKSKTESEPLPMTVTDHSWLVGSETFPGVVYTVTRTTSPGTSGEDAEVWSCTCAHFRYRRAEDPAITDKHIDAVRAHLAKERAGLAGLDALTPADLAALAAASDAFARLATTRSH